MMKVFSDTEFWRPGSILNGIVLGNAQFISDDLIEGGGLQRQAGGLFPQYFQNTIHNSVSVGIGNAGA